jgi:hypothetical protein
LDESEREDDEERDGEIERLSKEKSDL